MPNKVSPSPVGSSPVYIPTASRLLDIDLSYSPTISKNPHNALSHTSPTPSLMFLLNPSMDPSDNLSVLLYTWIAKSLDLFIEDLAASLKKYHFPKFDALALLDDYGFQNGLLHERTSSFQARLLAVLAHWETPHVKGFCLISLNEELPSFCIHLPCSKILMVSYHGEDLYTFSHTYLLPFSHITFALHQILDELVTLNGDPQGFIFEPGFKALRSFEGVPDLFLLKVTWGILMFHAKKAHKRTSNELCTHCIALMQNEGASVHSNNSTVSVVQEEFLRNSPCTNVLQLLQREDYHTGIPVTVQEPVYKGLQNLPKPLPVTLLFTYHSDLEPVSTAPAILPSITTSHLVQVHFATTAPSMKPIGLCQHPTTHPNMATTPLPLAPPTNDRMMIIAVVCPPALKVNNPICCEILPIHLPMTIWVDEEGLGEEAMEKMALRETAEVMGVAPAAMAEETEDLDRALAEIEAQGGLYNPFQYPGRNNPPPPPGPNRPDGGYDSPDPPPPVGNLPLVTPQQPADFCWQLSSNILLLTIPEWNSSPTSVIYNIFTGLAKTWFNGLLLADCLTCTANMTNFLIFIHEQFMHTKWHYDQGLKFDCMYFRRATSNFSTLMKLKSKLSYAVVYLINGLDPGELTFSMSICKPSVNYWNMSVQRSLVRMGKRKKGSL
ncbi:hypothetical protein BDN71DRAFT_1436778 [Pleurotus eryngii]|uniref:Uncharacterized protein n=1 Tax=Pleurotus eryngii TaxID=5323 RepID=A0A9P6D9D4_PLEER|nr:hypothetical protein BDN71DRAFT_1436778 [Pleurotus eryngii]